MTEQAGDSTRERPERPEQHEGPEPAEHLEELHQKVLSEDVQPAEPAPHAPTFQAVTEARMQDNLHKTRKLLAIGLFGLVAVMTMVPIVALVLSYWTHFTVDEFKELGLFFTPIVTLASAAFGFFFATDDRDRRH